MTTQKNAIEKAIDALAIAKEDYNSALFVKRKQHDRKRDNKSICKELDKKSKVVVDAIEALRAAQKVDDTKVRTAIAKLNDLHPFWGNDAKLCEIFRPLIDAATGRLAGVPEGYVLVPLEETEKIRDAVERHIDNYGTLYDAWYEDMIAAAQEEK